jgi:2-hydroxy-6-oxonona-2,4-dienedioate hydrolase
VTASTSVTTQSAWLEHLDGGQVIYYDAEGIATRCLQAGSSGPAILLLHGTGGHAETFLRNVVALSKLGFRAYAIDMVGCGLTDKPAERPGYTVQDYTDHVAAFLRAAGLTDVTVVGESLGGWVAMRAAIDHPELVSGVVNVTGGGLRFGEPTEQEMRGWSSLLERSMAAIEEGSWDTWRQRMNWLVLDPETMPDELVTVRQQIFARPEMKKHARRLYYLLEQRLDGKSEDNILSQDVLESVGFPVLYLWTTDNPTTPLSVAQRAQQVTPGSEIVVLENCAHWPQWESADEFNDLVANFARK